MLQHLYAKIHSVHSGVVTLYKNRVPFSNDLCPISVSSIGVGNRDFPYKGDDSDSPIISYKEYYKLYEIAKAEQETAIIIAVNALKKEFKKDVEHIFTSMDKDNKLIIGKGEKILALLYTYLTWKFNISMRIQTNTFESFEIAYVLLETVEEFNNNVSWLLHVRKIKNYIKTEYDFSVHAKDNSPQITLESANKYILSNIFKDILFSIGDNLRMGNNTLDLNNFYTETNAIKYLRKYLEEYVP